MPAGNQNPEQVSTNYREASAMRIDRSIQQPVPLCAIMQQYGDKVIHLD